VILGDKWKSMESEERHKYVQEAKQLAEEHKKVNPDCWKRKRTGAQVRDHLDKQKTIYKYRLSMIDPF
jgi:hypothetical protein